MDNLESKVEKLTFKDLSFFFKYYYIPLMSKKDCLITNDFFRDISGMMIYLNEIRNENKNWKFLLENTVLPDNINSCYKRIINYITSVN